MTRLISRMIIVLLALVLAFPALAERDEERANMFAERLERLEAILIELQPIADDSHPRLAEILKGSRDMLKEGRWDALEEKLRNGEDFVGIDERGGRIEIHEPYRHPEPMGQIDLERFREDFMRDREEFRHHLERLEEEGFMMEEFFVALEELEPEEDMLLEESWDRLHRLREEAEMVVHHREMEQRELQERIEHQKHRFNELVEIAARLNSIGEMERAREMLEMAMQALDEQQFLMELREVLPHERPFVELERDLHALHEHAEHLEMEGAKTGGLYELLEEIEATLEMDNFEETFELMHRAWMEAEELEINLEER